MKGQGVRVAGSLGSELRTGSRGPAGCSHEKTTAADNVASPFGSRRKCQFLLEAESTKPMQSKYHPNPFPSWERDNGENSWRNGKSPVFEIMWAWVQNLVRPLISHVILDNSVFSGPECPYL